jgi:dUTP pyrophosphatase
MKIPIKRIDREVPLPEYKTEGAAAMDCYVRESGTVPAKGVARVPLNFALKPPPGHFVLLAARSSLHKRGLMFANGVGIFDEDYCGDKDEFTAILYNFTDAPVTIERGDRIAQIILLPLDRMEWNEVDTLDAPNRGGIGSTGI